MNFFEGKIEIKGNIPAFVLNDGTTIVLSTLNDRMSSYVDKEMALGVRPEHLAIARLARQSDNMITATVKLIETLGDRKDVYLTTKSGQTFVANLSSYVNINKHDNVRMVVDTPKAHVFELGDTGVNIFQLKATC